jgi:metallophosphoesterase superfamily enzyme
MRGNRTTTSAGIDPVSPWTFTPEGAAIHPGERTAVIADVHLGYEWAAGDLVESARPCRRTAEDVRRLREWLEGRGVSLLALEGNHDRGRLLIRRPSTSTSTPPDPTSGSTSTGDSRLPAACTVDGWTIAHGHRPITGKNTVSGHFHPVIRVEGTAAPCFLAGPGRIVLPAFSRNAAGCDVLTAAIPREWLDESLRCIASTGSELLDFGPLPAIRRSLARS